MHIKPSGESCFIPEFEIAATVRQDTIGMPIGVRLQGRGIDVHVVGHIVKNHIHTVLVCGSQHVVQLLLGSETLFYLGSKNRPITVITRELGIGLGVVVFVAVRERIHAPCIPWVLCDRGDPDSSDAQILEEAIFNLLLDTLDVAPLIVHDVQNLWAVHLPIVVFVSVVETVNHQRVEDLCVVVETGELSYIVNHLAVLHRNEQVVEVFSIGVGVYANEATPFAFTPCRFDSDGSLSAVLLVVDVLLCACVLPEYAELQVLILVKDTDGNSRIRE